MIRLVIFDMDGTLADTSPGILNSHRYAHRMMGRNEPTDHDLHGVIGGPLLSNYQTRFAFPEEQARKAIAHYRSYYAEKGIHEAKLYPGIKELLSALKEEGLLLGVATLKAERFVKIMLQNMGVSGYFDAIYGMDGADTRTKADLLRLCMAQTKVSANETVLIGDSIHDHEGAAACDVSFVGVTYGFGFTDSAYPENMNACSSAHEVLNAVKGLKQC